MLRCEKVGYTSPPPRRKKVFEGLNFRIPKKRNTVIYGDNGAGKTTLLKLLAGIKKPDSGKILKDESAVAVFENIEEQLLFSTVKEEMKSVTGAENDEIMDKLNLSNLTERSTLELSFTEKVRLVFFIAWAAGKHYLLLDSPVNDKLLNDSINYIAEERDRTVVLFLPAAEEREFTSEWKKFTFKGKNLIDKD